MSRPVWLAGAAAAVALATGSAAVALAAPSRRPMPDVTVHRFVVRDQAGHVVARGATATLPGHRAMTRPTMTSGRTRVATLHRGGHVVVTHVGPGSAGRAVTATR